MGISRVSAQSEEAIHSNCESTTTTQQKAKRDDQTKSPITIDVVVEVLRLVSARLEALDEFQRQLRARIEFQLVDAISNTGGVFSPIHRLDWHLLVNELATLLEDEVAPLRLASLSCAKRRDEYPLGIREERIRQIFLQMDQKVSGGHGGSSQ